jgi:ribose transport system permease protein
MYATGGNADAARLAGVRTDRVVFGTLVFTAVIAGIAGIVVTSRLGTGSPTIGPPYLLPAYAAAFLGSTQVKPGKFNVLGTLIAVFALATSVKGLQLAGAADWLPDLFNGVALILAVGLSVRRRRG